MALSETEFERLADRTLNQIVEALADAEEEGLDADLESGVLSIQFEDDSKYVVNSHRAAKQIWMAADAAAWHFEWDGKAWLSTKTGEELWTLLRERVSRKLGKTLDLHPPR
jgi:CyaY protein